MGSLPLWKYCTPQHCNEYILSLKLLGETGWTAQKELACLYAVSNYPERHYRSVTLRKKDGTPRRLMVPDPLLKKIQRNILHNLLDQMQISPYATAYCRGSGILDNARPHVGQHQVLKMDIKGFFDSILFPMVYKSAFSNRRMPPEAGVLLTSLCCYRDYLPQGAPTSAAISNLVMRPFDSYMGRWCRERGIVYTRYCDDMTFSGVFDTYLVRNKAGGFLQAMGFTVNSRKTRVLTEYARQTVTGIVVNEKPQTEKRYRRELRQEIYYCRTYGVRSHLERVGGPDLFQSDGGVFRYLSSLLGKVNYVLQVNPTDQFFIKARKDIKTWIEYENAERI